MFVIGKELDAVGGHHGIVRRQNRLDAVFKKVEIVGHHGIEFAQTGKDAGRVFFADVVIDENAAAVGF